MYDLAVIGGGPAGLTAALYAARARLKTVVCEKRSLGGQISYTDIIENYPGVGRISGRELISRFKDQLSSYELSFVYASIDRLEAGSPFHTLSLSNGTSIQARAVIIASGSTPRQLGVPGEGEFVGRGVSYCATCDGPLYADGHIVVIGGGDTAVKEALFLSKIARKVYLVHRRDALRAEKIYQEKLLNSANIHPLWSSVVERIEGESAVSSVVVSDLKTGLETSFDADGVFIFVGINPVTGFVGCDKDEQGFIVTDAQLQTSVPGIFAAGDCRVTGLRQVATAVGDGALAAVSAEQYLSDL